MRVGQHEFEVSTEPFQDGWRSVAFLPGGKQRSSATCGSREEAEMDLYRRLKDEFDSTPQFDPTKNYEDMSTASQLVAVLLDSYDEHIKAHQLVKKWDNAHSSYIELAKLKKQAVEKFKEIGQALSLERALAHNGLRRKEDVARVIYGDQVGATDNYKRLTPVRTCTNTWCNARGKPQPMQQEACRDCQEPLQTVQKPTSPSDLRTKLAKHIVGVETNDGRKVWFDEPIPPRYHDYGA